MTYVPPQWIGIAGGLILAPLFGVICARIGQYRYRRAMAIKLGKSIAEIPKRSISLPVQRAMVFGIMASGFAGMASDPGGPMFPLEPWQLMLRWVSVVALIYALAAAVRLAKVGMPPEANFNWREDVGIDIEAKSPRLAHAGKPAMPAAWDLFDSREV